MAVTVVRMLWRLNTSYSFVDYVNSLCLLRVWELGEIGATMKTCVSLSVEFDSTILLEYLIPMLLYEVVEIE